MGAFYFSFKAFDLLDRLDAEGEGYEDALKGSVVGVFQMVVAGKESPEHLIEVVNSLRNAGNNP